MSTRRTPPLSLKGSRVVDEEMTRPPEDTPERHNNFQRVHVRASAAARAARARESVARVTQTAEVLARAIFGCAAYVRIFQQTDRETGRLESVLEVHYCFPNDFERLDELAGLHERFMAQYAGLPGSLRRHVVMTSIATDD
ncbi:MAG TPA: hypothetical protein VGO40_19975 [Longimicrobium sp.]|jgi:hypothetical protein|nr:hypothetical protein [Longimicrobium sp.]